MDVKTLFLSVLFVSMLLLSSLPTMVTSAVDFDQEMYDPIGDVKKASESGFAGDASGRDYLDIVYLQSEERSGSILTGDLIAMNIQVAGNIRDDPDVQYIYVVITGADTFIFQYTNDGTPLGVRLSDGTVVVATASKSGNTLTIEVRKDALIGATSSFEWKAAAVESDDDETYGDMAPDKLVRITYPYHTSTKFGTVGVEGITQESIYSINDVEFRIDGTIQPLTTTDGFATWSFDWDTTSLPAWPAQ